MKINNEIKEILNKGGISIKDAIPYLLSLYFGYEEASYLPNLLKSKIFATGIIREEKGEIRWIVSLFEDGEADDAFSWVITEYIPLFLHANKNKQPHKRECLSRMKDLFRQHPEIRKDQVMRATRMYIESTDAQFIRDPHYFIYKGLGKDRTSDLLSTIDKILEEENGEDKVAHKSKIY